MIDVQNKTRLKRPTIPFAEMTTEALGEDYDLSLVFIGSTRSRSLNKKYRSKDKPTNILSFPLSDTDGEIFIDLRLSYSQAADYKRSHTNFIAFLFIHGLMHLKGYDHGSTMERKEALLRAKFGV